MAESGESDLWMSNNKGLINTMSNKINSENCCVSLLLGDESLKQELTNLLKQSGCTVQQDLGISHFKKNEPSILPAVFIIDALYSEGNVTGLELIKNLKEKNNEHPIIFIAESDDASHQLAAARVGVDRFFSRPLNLGKLFKTIDTFQTSVDAAPYRVLVIDDDVPLLKFYNTMLTEAGMAVESYSNPLDGIKSLKYFLPDVVITDLYMEQCSGPELVKIIRQNDSWSHIPILFLSAEQNINTQLDAMKLGAEDFITKPVEPKKLVMLTTATIKKARKNIKLNNDLKIALRENKNQIVAMNQHNLVSIADVGGSIIYSNDKFCEVSGYSREELLGKNHRILKSGWHPESFYEEMWEVLSKGVVWRGTICNVKKNGEEYWVNSTIVPFLDDSEKPYKYVSVRTDLTDMLLSKERFDRSQEFANIGTWDWNIVTDELYWSDQIWSLFGYKKEETDTTYDNFLAAVHIDDRQAVIAAVNDCVEKGAQYNIEHRVVWPDGSEHWVLEKGDVVRNVDGKALHMLGVVQDITERKLDKLRIIERERELVEAQQLSKIGNWTADIVSGDLNWSDEIYHIFGFEQAGFKPSVEAFHAAVHPDDRTKVRESETRAQSTGIHDVVHRIVRSDGSIRHVHELAEAENDADGNVLRMKGTVQDVTQQVQMELALAKQTKLLDMLHQSMTEFVETNDIRKAMNRMLDSLLELSESEYGFAGEVLWNSDGDPYLKTYAITNIAWDEKTTAFYEESYMSGLEFHNLNTLFGHVMTSRQSVYTNDPSNDPRAGGLPDGHPAMHSFLGVPILYGNELIGMYGIANGKNGFDEELQKLLRPFDATFGVMINSIHMLQTEELNRKELIKAKELAEEASKAKSHFLSSMSHELRTPMNAIMGFSQLMRIENDPPLNKEQMGNVNEIMKAAKHLMELINEVLDLARIEVGRIDLSIEAVSLCDVVTDAILLVTSLAENRGIEISMRQNDVDINYEDFLQLNYTVRADRTRLKQVVLNLLSNAVKYNKEKGKIVINCTSTENKSVRINVTDTGIGISEEKQKDLFTAFNRLGAEHSEIEGSGIGLVITKNIVELMAGSIGVESREDEGSIFWIELPSDDEENLSKVEGIEESVPDNLEEKQSVLYIEDNPANLRLVSQLLSRVPNLHMWSAHEPILGLELAKEHIPNLILLDINLPGIDGFEVLKQLRESEITRNIPVIAISANAMPADIKRGEKAGFDDYITKPIDIKALLHAVNEKLVSSIE